MKYSLDTYLYASAFSLAVGAYSFRKKSVSWSGLAALVIISFTVIWLDELPLLFPLFYMFATSSLFSSLWKREKKKLEEVLSKSGPRDCLQALANLGVAFVFILVYHVTKNPLWVVAMISSVATGNADSWASEIGALSPKPPVSLLTFKPMTHGISGGVTPVGTLWGFTGSFFIAFFSLATLEIMDSCTVSVVPARLAIGFAGFLGMLFDSLLGLLFQALYQDARTLAFTEQAEGNKLVKGISWMNNDMVNFLSTLFGGVVGMGVYGVI